MRLMNRSTRIVLTILVLSAAQFACASGNWRRQVQPTTAPQQPTIVQDLPTTAATLAPTALATIAATSTSVSATQATEATSIPTAAVQTTASDAIGGNLDTLLDQLDQANQNADSLQDIQ
jgi:hypothetical protein